MGRGRLYLALHCHHARRWGKRETIPKMWGKRETIPRMWGKRETIPKRWGKRETIPSATLSPCQEVGGKGDCT